MCTCGHTHAGTEAYKHKHMHAHMHVLCRDSHRHYVCLNCRNLSQWDIYRNLFGGLTESLLQDRYLDRAQKSPGWGAKFTGHCLAKPWVGPGWLLLFSFQRSGWVIHRSAFAPARNHCIWLQVFFGGRRCKTTVHMLCCAAPACHVKHSYGLCDGSAVDLTDNILSLLCSDEGG